MMDDKLPRVTDARADDRSGMRGAVFVALVIAAASVALGFMAIIESGLAMSAVMIGVLAVLAALGAVGLVALAFGLIDVAAPRPRDGLTERIAETASEGFVVAGRNGEILYANASYLGFSNAPSQLEARPVDRIFIGGADVQQSLYRLMAAAREGRSVREEFRLPQAIGSKMPGWYRVRTQPLPGPRGETYALFGVSDITRERERQENVFQELQYAIDYLDHAPAGFFSVHPDGEVVYINATLASWLGRDLAQFGSGGLHVSDLVTENSASLIEPDKGAAGSSRTRIIDLDFKRASGQSFPVRLFHQVRYDAAGEAGPSRTLVLDRTVGLSSDEGQRLAEVRFARFFNNSPFAIATIARDGRILRTNAPFKKLLPVATRDPSGSVPDIFALVATGEAEMLRKRMNDAASGHTDLTPVDVQFTASDRSARLYVTAADAGHAHEDEAAILYALDITEQRVLEAQFAQAQKMQAVGELAGGVAHDFNNVLQVILGHADMLLTSHRPTDPSFQDIMQIKNNVIRAANLVRHLLAFSRRQTLRPEVMLFTDALAEMSTMLKRSIGYQVELNVHHERDLWPVKADVMQFEQVIINLAVNARDAMPQGGRLTIRTSNIGRDASADLGDPTIPLADYVMVEIADTGCGIAPEILAKIFEPFFTTKDVGKGTGLGLSMVYGFVKQSGGFILCDSEPGKGTRFRILLPRFVAGSGERIDMAATALARPATDVTGEETILIVDDEDAVRAFAVRALTQRGYKVFEAASGVDALEVLDGVDGQVDLIVSDVVMPEMDGPTMLGKIRERGIRVPVIFASGYAEDAFAKNLPDGEKFGFLPKPFSLKQLVEMVKSELSGVDATRKRNS